MAFTTVVHRRLVDAGIMQKAPPLTLSLEEGLGGIRKGAIGIRPHPSPATSEESARKK